MIKKGKAILLSTVIMVISCAALLALLALIFSKTGTLPKNIIPVLITGVCALSAFLGGLAASWCSREKGILFGLIAGGIFSIVVIFVSVVIFQSSFSAASAVRVAAIILSGCIGGILGVNRKTKVKF